MIRPPVLRVREEVESGEVPLWKHPLWAERFPWLVQATTGRGIGPEPFDLGLFGSAPVGPTIDRWRRLREAVDMRSALHSRQVHGVRAEVWDGPLPPGLSIGEGLDAHITGHPGLLLAVSVADCVPIFLVAEEARLLGVVHSGWRGVAAGALEAALELFRRREVSLDDVWLHAGPSICGSCYEVGPEVHAAVNPSAPVPSQPTPIDLREAIVRRAHALGVPDTRISISTHCTRCGPGEFFSHRAGDAGRQMAVLGILE